VPYTPQTWVDHDPSYPASASRLGHMESGIAAADAAITAHQAATTTFDGIASTSASWSNCSCVASR
jgi:hypothetical protein